MSKTDSGNRERLNALLAKADDDIENLDQQEVQELQRLVSCEIAKGFRDTQVELYKGKNAIASLLLEEMYRRRITRHEMCKILCLSREHFSKVLSGKARIGMQTVLQIHRNFGVDANYLIENL